MCKKPAERAGVTESLNRDLARISDWCSSYGMLLNPSKIISILFPRSRTPYPPFSDLSVNDCAVERVDEVLILEFGLTLSPPLSMICERL